MKKQHHEVSDGDIETIKSILIHVMESLAGRSEEELEEISERIQSGESIAFRIGQV